MAFQFKEDRPRGTLTYTSPGAGTAITAGQLVLVSSNALSTAVAGSAVWAIANEAKASAAAATALEVTPVKEGDVLVALMTTTPMAASYVGSTCDIVSGGLSLNAAVDTQHDATIIGWDGVDTTKAYVVLNNVVF